MAKLTTILQLVSGELTESRIRRAARRLEEIPTNEPRFLQIKTAVLAAGLNFLRDAGVAEAEWIRHCTYSNPDLFYSYRRSVHQSEADYGRLISAIRL